MTKIKICGLFRPEDIEAVNRARPDYVGFVFASSRRKVDESTAATLRAILDDGIVPVGVFVDGEMWQVEWLYKNNVIEVAQLHGHEDAAYITRLKEKCPGLPLIKAVTVTSPDDIARAAALDTEAVLLDSGKGTGSVFDWGFINEVGKRFFLAGGINCENINRALAFQPYAIDVSSGAETNGLKDADKINALVQIAHGA